MDADGDFVIAWNSDFDGTEGIDFSRFSSAGALLGTGNIPHPSTKRISVNPDIFVSATGSFVIAYEQAPIIGWNINVLASMFQADGTLVKSIKVARDQPRELAPSIAGAADGRFAIIYTKGIPQADPLKNKLFAQRYSTSGALLGKHKLVSGLDTYPNTDVAMDNSGNVLAGWQQYDHSNVDGTIDYYSLRVRSITAAGVMSPEVVIDPNLSFETVSLALAKDGSGSFVATTHAGAGFRIVEVLSAGGVYTATEVLVANTGSQAFDYGGDPIVSIDDANGYVVAVNSESGMYASDGDSWGVFTQFGELGS
jgi:hypothetical protein